MATEKKGTLTEQREQLRKDLEDARTTIILQNNRINDLLKQLQGRIEDSPLFKAQVESFKISEDTKQIRSPKKKGNRTKAELEEENQRLMLLAADRLDRIEMLLKENISLGKQVNQLEKELAEAKAGVKAEPDEPGQIDGQPKNPKRGRKYTYSPETRKQIHELRKSGYTIRTISSLVDVSKSRVAEILAESI